MSLINEMLRDLEARRGPTAPPMDRALDGLNAVGAWPEGPARTLPWALLVGAGVVAAAIALRPAPWAGRADTPLADAVAIDAAASLLPPPSPVQEPPGLPARDPFAGVPQSTSGAGSQPAPRSPEEPVRVAELTPAPPLEPARATPRTPSKSLVGSPERRRRADAVRITDELRAEARAIEAATPELVQPAEPSAALAQPSAGEQESAATVESPGTFRREQSTLAAPTAGEVELARARNLLQGGDRGRGLAALKAYVLGHPQAHRARLLFARELLKDSRRTEAEAVLRMGLALAPRHTAFAQLLAHLMFDDRRSAAALEVLRAAAPPVAVDPEYHAFMAAICQQTGQHRAAFEIYRTIVAVHPTRGSATLGMAISLAALGDVREAADAFRRAAADSALSGAVRDYAQAEARRLEQGP